MKKLLCINAVFFALFCMSLVSAAADEVDPQMAPVDSLDVMGQVMSAEAITTATPWGAPVLVSPNNGRTLYHYPRATTLAWQPVTGATSYKVERAYYTGTWQAYAPVTVTGNNNTSYTFDFVGDQKGRWRVTAYNGKIRSTPSAWWKFSYVTTPQMPTPIPTNPAADQILSNYPRWLTLSWKMIPEAVGYKLEISFCQPGQVNCVNYAPVIINDPQHAYYTFQFGGAQPGRWRVSTLGSPTYTNSAPSKWRWFTFDK
jgi:hypothetical protein